MRKWEAAPLCRIIYFLLSPIPDEDGGQAQVALSAIYQRGISSMVNLMWVP